MKQLIRFCVVGLALMAAFNLQARTISVDIDARTSNLTEYLRSLSNSATYDDTLILNFGKGSFILNGTVEFMSSVIINGAGMDQTTIILNKGSNSKGFKAFTDDTFIMFHGRLEHPIAVEIANLSIKLKEHEGIWWEDSERYAVKIYHANHINVHDVDSYLENAYITNFDLRVCSNVTFANNTITNYNNCETGGCLWIRGEMHNITIKNNQFFKYGNDEIIGVFGKAINADGNVSGNAKRTDIFIENNKIHYGYQGKDKVKDMTNHTLFTIQTADSKGQYTVTTSNVHVKNNKFIINDECTRCIFVDLPYSDRQQDIYFENNEIVNENLRSSKRYYRQDFEIKDQSKEQKPIHIINNTITNHNSVLTPYNTVGYSVLLIQGGNIDMSGNKIVNTVATDPFTGKENGVQLIWCGANGGTITMRDNVCKGIKCISTVGAGNGTDLFTLNANNNYFKGDTRIYCHKINELHLNFTGNTFKSNDMNFFLQEFAQKGSVIFNNNDVTVSSGDGRFMTHWSNASTDSMKFTRLEVKGNVFRGVKGEQDMFKKITNVKKRSIRSNKYGR